MPSIFDTHVGPIIPSISVLRNSILRLVNGKRGRFGGVQLPSEEEARCWLLQWREGSKPKAETTVRKIVIPRNQDEVRE